MTDKKTEALKLALEALEGMYIEGFTQDNSPINNALTAIREALAEQCVCGEPDTLGTHRTDGPCLAEQPAQPIRWDSNAGDMTGAMATLPKTGSESVVDYKPVISDIGADANIAGIPGTYYGIVLKGTGKITVTNGVQRKPWVGLTDEEIEEIWEQAIAEDNGRGGHLSNQPFVHIARAIEAKLKEKNNG